MPPILTDDLVNAFMGQIVLGYLIMPDGASMLIELAHQDYYLKVEAEGECCSECWIESLDAPGNLLHAQITKVERIDMPNRGDVGTRRHPHVDHVDYYGIRFTTEKGVCVLDFRNDSNGFYGGDVTVSRLPYRRGTS